MAWRCRSLVVVATADVDRRPAARRVSALVGALLAVILTSGCGAVADSSVNSSGGSVGSTNGAAPTAVARPTPTATRESAAGTTPPLAPLAGTPDSQTYPFRPTTLVLPSGVTAAVDPVGLDSANALQVPADLGRVGWWTGGALAGEPFGSVVLAGHLDSRTQGIGVMAELLDAKTDDRVVVSDGTRTQAYRVVSVDAVPKARLGPDTETFDQDVDHRLVLVTCGGAFDPATHSYADNVVVIAVPTT